MITRSHVLRVLTHLGFGGFAMSLPESLEDVQALTNNGKVMVVRLNGATCDFQWSGFDRPQQPRQATLTLEGDMLTFTETFAPRSHSERSHWRSLYCAVHDGDDGMFEVSTWAELAARMVLPGKRIVPAGTSHTFVQDELATADPTIWRWHRFSWPVTCIHPGLWTGDPHLPMEITDGRPIGPWTSFGLIHDSSNGRVAGSCMVTPFRRFSISA